mgnify:CR=1 FL=1
MVSCCAVLSCDIYTVLCRVVLCCVVLCCVVLCVLHGGYIGYCVRVVAHYILYAIVFACLVSRVLHVHVHHVYIILCDSLMESIMGKKKQKSIKDMIPFFKEDPCCADMYGASYHMDDHP